MTKPEVWMRPDVMLGNPEMIRCVENHVPYTVQIETTGKCAGSCIYCYSSSTGISSGSTLPTDRVYKLLDEIKEIGAPGVIWHGGDPVLHPEIWDLIRYNTDLGQRNVAILPNPMSITKKVARHLVDQKIESVAIHIDTIDPTIYNQVHKNPKSLEKKIHGYKNLLDAGYPPSQVWAPLTLTKYSIKSIKETIDWFVDEMNAGFICLLPFKTVGLARNSGLEYLEPSSSEVKEAYEYRARKLGDDNWLRLGTTDGRVLCKSYIQVKDDGDVIPCSLMQDVVVGNIHQESLVDIFHKNKDLLLFEFEIKGPCGNCKNNDICHGCRANAFYFTGDMQASDPKCWWNPESREYATNPEVSQMP